MATWSAPSAESSTTSTEVVAPAIATRGGPESTAMPSAVTLASTTPQDGSVPITARTAAGQSPRSANALNTSPSRENRAQ
jgi:hypothetical protein